MFSNSGSQAGLNLERMSLRLTTEGGGPCMYSQETAVKTVWKVTTVKISPQRAVQVVVEGNSKNFLLVVKSTAQQPLATLDQTLTVQRC
jgi:hypothetical protein